MSIIMTVTKPKRFVKISQDATREIITYEHTCQKCGHVWISEIKIPKNCTDYKCRSPTWNMER